MPANALAITDTDLIIRIRCHDEAALALLYDRYIRLVYAVAVRITGDRQTAEEVVQDVFQNVWQTAAGFQPAVGSCATWLLSITRHRAIDTLRSKRERARVREQALPLTVPMDTAHQPEAAVERRAVCADVRAALRTLPTHQRHVIELAYYGGLTCGEIAERLGEPLGTVKTRMRLGLFKLRDAFAERERVTFAVIPINE